MRKRRGGIDLYKICLGLNPCGFKLWIQSLTKTPLCQVARFGPRPCGPPAGRAAGPHPRGHGAPGRACAGRAGRGERGLRYFTLHFMLCIFYISYFILFYSPASFTQLPPRRASSRPAPPPRPRIVRHGPARPLRAGSGGWLEAGAEPGGSPPRWEGLEELLVAPGSCGSAAGSLIHAKLPFFARG